MTEQISLTCLFYGDEALGAFVVELDIQKAVGILKKSIKDMVERRVDLTTLRLFKVCIPDDDEAALNAFVAEENEERGVYFLRPARPLADYFVTQPALRQIHVIIVQKSDKNDSTHTDKMSDDMTKLSRMLELHRIITPDPPSKSSKSGVYKKIQGTDEPIYDGRYLSQSTIDTRAPPISLYHPAFSHFLDDIANSAFEVPTKVVQAASRLMDCSSAIYDVEEQRRNAILPHLSDALATPMPQLVNLDKNSPDGTVAVKTSTDTRYQLAAICIREDKNEIGDRGSDPSTEAALSYVRFWAQKDHAKVVHNSCCPTFLLAIAGPWLAVLGAVCTHKIVVQRLTNYIWICHDNALNEPSIYRVARVLHALGENIRRLELYYKSLKIPSPIRIGEPHPRFFPSINVFRASDNSIVKFTYIKALEEESICTTFLAKTKDPASTSVVVKFVHRYNEDAHRLLADEDMAPKLLYFGKLGIDDTNAPSYDHLRMVVMEFVDGTTSNLVQRLPALFGQRIREILTRLHDKGYVFGDLRGPNVMITKEEKVQLIDFDWVGKDGESTYPIMMSQSIKWPEGVGSGLSVMKKCHDFAMLKELLACRGLDQGMSDLSL